METTPSSQAPSTGTPDAGEREPVELTLWVISRNTDDWAAEMENKFLNEHSWITLNKVVKEGDPGNESYQGVVADTAPDLVRCSFTVMNNYMAAGILGPLNTYTDNWDEWGSFIKEYVDMFTQGGKVYGVPVRVAPMPFAYNKALFEQAGISDPPKTWDEALEDAKAIGWLEFYGKANFGTYVDRAVQNILTVPSANPKTEFGEAQTLAKRRPWRPLTRQISADRDLQITLSDNGSGITPEHLAVLRDAISQQENPEKSFGLRNVHQRIRLFYGEAYGLSIRSALEEGSEVNIRLPYRDHSEKMEIV